MLSDTLIRILVVLLWLLTFCGFGLYAVGVARRSFFSLAPHDSGIPSISPVVFDTAHPFQQFNLSRFGTPLRQGPYDLYRFDIHFTDRFAEHAPSVTCFGAPELFCRAMLIQGRWGERPEMAVSSTPIPPCPGCVGVCPLHLYIYLPASTDVGDAAVRVSVPRAAGSTGGLCTGTRPAYYTAVLTPGAMMIGWLGCWAVLVGIYLRPFASFSCWMIKERGMSASIVVYLGLWLYLAFWAKEFPDPLQPKYTLSLAINMLLFAVLCIATGNIMSLLNYFGHFIEKNPGARTSFFALSDVRDEEEEQEMVSPPSALGEPEENDVDRGDYL